MAYQTPITIKSALDQIWRHELILPAIQREFVWKPEQIRRFFDSLMQNFPVGSFLFWKIDTQTSNKFRFFDFAREYHERDNPHSPPLGHAAEGPITAVLDGQQRLTALNIGLRGSMAVKEPHKRWSNPNAFPKKQLYLDLLNDLAGDEEGTLFRFEFLAEEKAHAQHDGEHWFPVSKIFDMVEPYDVMSFLGEAGLGSNNQAVRRLSQLHKVVHVGPIINFYEEKSQDIEKVLRIFIRTNSGGTVLSYSDLLLSIATAQWEKRDARSEIHKLVDELNQVQPGFNFSKDFVLKAGLMLSDIASVGFKVENFGRSNMAHLEERWQKISDALRVTIQLAASFGLSRETIRADSALLPVAYYIYKRSLDEKYLTRPSDAEDRTTIKSWLIRSLIKPGIWGSGLDVLLTALREIVKSQEPAKFPIQGLEREMRLRGKGLSFSSEELEELVDTPYGSRDLFGLMTLMFPFVDTRNQFHIDHVFPKAAFHARKLQKLEMTPDQITRLQDLKERLPNLQLLEGPQNQSKGDMMPSEWLRAAFPNEVSRKDYISRHEIQGADGDLQSFDEFYKNRRFRLLNRIGEILNAETAETQHS